MRRPRVQQLVDGDWNGPLGRPSRRGRKKHYTTSPPRSTPCCRPFVKEDASYCKWLTPWTERRVVIHHTADVYRFGPDSRYPRGHLASSIWSYVGVVGDAAMHGAHINMCWELFGQQSHIFFIIQQMNANQSQRLCCCINYHIYFHFYSAKDLRGICLNISHFRTRLFLLQWSLPVVKFCLFLQHGGPHYLWPKELSTSVSHMCFK